MATRISNRTPYMAAFSQWQREFGPQPTEAQLAVAHCFGRAGKQSLTLAMAMRENGVTRHAMGHASCLLDNSKPTPHRNHILGDLGVVASGHFTRDVSVPKGVIKVTLTSKGQALVDAKGEGAFIKLKAAVQRKAAANPAPVEPPKKASKPRKAKPVTEQPVEVEAVPVEAPVDQPVNEAGA